MSTSHAITFDNPDFSTELDLVKNKKALYVLRAINHTLRLEILKLLHRNEKITVTEIYTKLNVEQAIVSHHLAILRRAGFVTTKKESKYVYYALSYQFLNHFSSTIQQLFSV